MVTGFDEVFRYYCNDVVYFCYVFHGCNYVFCYVFLCILYFNAVATGFIRCMFQCYDDVLRLCSSGVATWFPACLSVVMTCLCCVFQCCSDVFLLCVSVL